MCEATGEFKKVLADSPGDGFYIEKIITYTKGFIIAGDKGQMMVFVTTGEPNNPYTRIASLPSPQDTGKFGDEQHRTIEAVSMSRIKSMDLSAAEDTLIFATDNNQLYRMAISLLDNKNVEAAYDYLVHPFHSRAIQGMDVCIKKNLVVTCSQDKTVKLWSYSATMGFALEINEQFTEEAFCVAFHPSGFQIVVGFFDKIRMMNVLADAVQKKAYKEINEIRGCREIKFSHGGHLFACQKTTSIVVHKFFTAEEKYIFKAHQGHIRSIAWLEDDTGLVTSAWDATICMWKLKPAEGEANPMWQLNYNNVNFTCVTVHKPENEKGPPIVYATGQDKSIREIRDGKETLRFE